MFISHESFITKSFQKCTMHKINWCKGYIQGLTIWYPINGFGDRFKTAYNVIRYEITNSQFNWPKTTRPSSSYIKTWQIALRFTFNLHRGKTTYCLGNLLHSAYVLQMDMFFNPIHNTLLQNVVYPSVVARPPPLQLSAVTWKVKKRFLLTFM